MAQFTGGDVPHVQGYLGKSPGWSGGVTGKVGPELYCGFLEKAWARQGRQI